MADRRMTDERVDEGRVDDDRVDDDVTTPADGDLVAEIRRRHGARADAMTSAPQTPAVAPTTAAAIDGGGLEDDENVDDDATLGADEDVIAQIRRDIAAKQADDARDAPASVPERSSTADETVSPGALPLPSTEPPSGGASTSQRPAPAPGALPSPGPSQHPPPDASAPAGVPLPPPGAGTSDGPAVAAPSGGGAPSPVTAPPPAAQPSTPAAPRRWTPPSRLPGATGAPDPGSAQSRRAPTLLVFVAGVVATLVIAAVFYLLVLRDDDGGGDLPADDITPGGMVDGELDDETVDDETVDDEPAEPAGEPDDSGDGEEGE